MLIKNPVFMPIILTIPDDAAVFSLLNPNETITRKIIMENYINFYSINPPQLNEVVFRFENFMDYESIHGLERCFVPMDMMKKYYTELHNVLQLLEEGYVISMPVDKSSIGFYGEKDKGTHRMLVFGADLENRYFICKDFQGHEFVECKVMFSEMTESVKKYDNPTSREADGVLALRIDRNVSTNIEYSKMLSEFHKLRLDIYDMDSGYGIGAISLFIEDAAKREWDDSLASRWYEVSNYMREASKLMAYRYDILSEVFYKKNKYKVENIKDDVQKLMTDTNRLYFKVSKLERKRPVLTKGISGELTTLANKCKEDFKKNAGTFCEIIENL